MPQNRKEAKVEVDYLKKTGNFNGNNPVHAGLVLYSKGKIDSAEMSEMLFSDIPSSAHGAYNLGKSGFNLDAFK